MLFRGEYEFLSNMYECEVKVNGLYYRNAESAFQSFKIVDREKRRDFVGLSGYEGKKLGKRVLLRDDWLLVRDMVMLEVVRCKFKDKKLRERLLSVKFEIVEDNYWNDCYWGVCKGKGENKLGKILMRVRDEILNESA